MGKKKKQEDPGSWHCSLVLEEGFSSLGLLVTKSSEQWRSIRIAERSCNGGKKKGTSTPSLSGLMHFPLMGQFGMATAMSSLLDSLAPHSLQLGREREREMSTISGQRPGELLAKYFSTNQEQSGWRMSPDCFGCMEQLFSETLPKWGSIVDGGLYPLEMPVRDISGSDGGVWLKNKDDQDWPTPTTQDGQNNGGPAQSERNSLPLNAQVGGRLNPAWVEWLMCFPIGWTSLEPMPAERMAEWEKGVLDGSWWAIDPAEDSWTDCDDVLSVDNSRSIPEAGRI